MENDSQDLRPYISARSPPWISYIVKRSTTLSSFNFGEEQKEKAFMDALESISIRADQLLLPSSVLIFWVPVFNVLDALISKLLKSQLLQSGLLLQILRFEKSLLDTILPTGSSTVSFSSVDRVIEILGNPTSPGELVDAAIAVAVTAATKSSSLPQSKELLGQIEKRKEIDLSNPTTTSLLAFSLYLLLQSEKEARKALSFMPQSFETKLISMFIRAHSSTLSLLLSILVKVKGKLLSTSPHLSPENIQSLVQFGSIGDFHYLRTIAQYPIGARKLLSGGILSELLTKLAQGKPDSDKLVSLMMMTRLLKSAPDQFILLFNGSFGFPTIISLVESLLKAHHNNILWPTDANDHHLVAVVQFRILKLTLKLILNLIQKFPTRESINTFPEGALPLLLVAILESFTTIPEKFLGTINEKADVDHTDAALASELRIGISLLIVEIFATWVHAEPTSLPIFYEKKIIEKILNFLLRPGVSARIIELVPTLLSAFSLNSDGLDLILSQSSLIEDSFSKAIVPPRPGPIMIDPDRFGESLDELARHQPSLKHVIAKSLISAIDRIKFLIGANFIPCPVDKCFYPPRTCLFYPEHSEHVNLHPHVQEEHEHPAGGWSEALESVSIVLELFFDTKAHLELFCKEFQGIEHFINALLPVKILAHGHFPEFDYCVGPEAYSVAFLLRHIGRETPAELGSALYPRISSILKSLSSVLNRSKDLEGSLLVESLTDTTCLAVPNIILCENITMTDVITQFSLCAIALRTFCDLWTSDRQNLSTLFPDLVTCTFEFLQENFRAIFEIFAFSVRLHYNARTSIQRGGSPNKGNLYLVDFMTSQVSSMCVVALSIWVRIISSSTHTIDFSLFQDFFLSDFTVTEKMRPEEQLYTVDLFLRLLRVVLVDDKGMKHMHFIASDVASTLIKFIREAVVFPLAQSKEGLFFSPKKAISGAHDSDALWKGDEGHGHVLMDALELLVAIQMDEENFREIVGLLFPTFHRLPPGAQLILLQLYQRGPTQCQRAILESVLLPALLSVSISNSEQVSSMLMVVKAGAAILAELTLGVVDITIGEAILESMTSCCLLEVGDSHSANFNCVILLVLFLHCLGHGNPTITRSLSKKKDQLVHLVERFFTGHSEWGLGWYLALLEWIILEERLTSLALNSPYADKDENLAHLVVSILECVASRFTGSSIEQQQQQQGFLYAVLRISTILTFPPGVIEKLSSSLLIIYFKFIDQLPPDREAGVSAGKRPSILSNDRTAVGSGIPSLICIIFRGMVEDSVLNGDNDDDYDDVSRLLLLQGAHENGFFDGMKSFSMSSFEPGDMVAGLPKAIRNPSLLIDVPPDHDNSKLDLEARLVAAKTDLIKGILEQQNPALVVLLRLSLAHLITDTMGHWPLCSLLALLTELILSYPPAAFRGSSEEAGILLCSIIDCLLERILGASDEASMLINFHSKAKVSLDGQGVAAQSTFLLALDLGWIAFFFASLLGTCIFETGKDPGVYVLERMARSLHSVLMVAVMHRALVLLVPRLSIGPFSVDGVCDFSRRKNPLRTRLDNSSSKGTNYSSLHLVHAVAERTLEETKKQTNDDNHSTLVMLTEILAFIVRMVPEHVVKSLAPVPVIVPLHVAEEEWSTDEGEAWSSDDVVNSDSVNGSLSSGVFSSDELMVLDPHDHRHHGDSFEESDMDDDDDDNDNTSIDTEEASESSLMELSSSSSSADEEEEEEEGLIDEGESALVRTSFQAMPRIATQLFDSDDQDQVLDYDDEDGDDREEEDQESEDTHHLFTTVDDDEDYVHGQRADRIRRPPGNNGSGDHRTRMPIELLVPLDEDVIIHSSVGNTLFSVFDDDHEFSGGDELHGGGGGGGGDTAITTTTTLSNSVIPRTADFFAHHQNDGDDDQPPIHRHHRHHHSRRTAAALAWEEGENPAAILGALLSCFTTQHRENSDADASHSDSQCNDEHFSSSRLLLGALRQRAALLALGAVRTATSPPPRNPALHFTSLLPQMIQRNMVSEVDPTPLLWQLGARSINVISDATATTATITTTMTPTSVTSNKNTLISIAALLRPCSTISRARQLGMLLDAPHDMLHPDTGYLLRHGPFHDDYPHGQHLARRHWSLLYGVCAALLSRMCNIIPQKPDEQNHHQHELEETNQREGKKIGADLPRNDNNEYDANEATGPTINVDDHITENDDDGDEGSWMSLDESISDNDDDDDDGSTSDMSASDENDSSNLSELEEGGDGDGDGDGDGNGGGGGDTNALGDVDSTNVDAEWPTLYVTPPALDCQVLEALPVEMQREILDAYFFERRENNPGQLRLLVSPEWAEANLTSVSLLQLFREAEATERRSYLERWRQRHPNPPSITTPSVHRVSLDEALERLYSAITPGQQPPGVVAAVATASEERGGTQREQPADNEEQNEYWSSNSSGDGGFENYTRRHSRRRYYGWSHRGDDETGDWNDIVIEGPHPFGMHLFHRRNRLTERRTHPLFPLDATMPCGLGIAHKAENGKELLDDTSTLRQEEQDHHPPRAVEEVARKVIQGAVQAGLCLGLGRRHHRSASQRILEAIALNWHEAGKALVAEVILSLCENNNEIRKCSSHHHHPVLLRMLEWLISIGGDRLERVAKAVLSLVTVNLDISTVASCRFLTEALILLRRKMSSMLPLCVFTKLLGDFISKELPDGDRLFSEFLLLLESIPKGRNGNDDGDGGTETTDNSASAVVVVNATRTTIMASLDALAVRAAKAVHRSDDIAVATRTLLRSLCAISALVASPENGSGLVSHEQPPSTLLHSSLSTQLNMLMEGLWKGFKHHHHHSHNHNHHHQKGTNPILLQALFLGASQDPSQNWARSLLQEAKGEEYRKMINQMIREQPSLLMGAFGPFKALGRQPAELGRPILDFDVKRWWLSRSAITISPNQRRKATPVSIRVSRERIFEDSFREIMALEGQYFATHPLSVVFEGEEGIDAGGLTREWFHLLAQQMLNPGYGLFAPAENLGLFYPSRYSSVNPDHLLYFEFVGRIIGKAIIESQLLDCHFATPFFKQILSVQLDLADLAQVDPAYHRSLAWMAEQGDTQALHELQLTMVTELDEFGRSRLIELVPGGSSIEVNPGNLDLFLQRTVEVRLGESLGQQFEAIKRGLFSVVRFEALRVMSVGELELIISGLPLIDDIDDWKRNTEYDGGYTTNSPQVIWFWRAVRAMSHQERALLLQFVTGSSKVPLGGFSRLLGSNSTLQRFSIHRDSGGSHRLPQAHTCFNQLDIPEYDSYEQLRERLLTAIREGPTGFGLL